MDPLPPDPAGWHWRPGPVDEQVLTRSQQAGLGTRFPSQAEAEAWLAEAWAGLAELGVSEVSLLQGDRVVYGPMGLDPG